MMSTPGIFVFITSIFKYYYFTSTRLACILVMRVESDSFWYTVKIGKHPIPIAIHQSPSVYWGFRDIRIFCLIVFLI